LGGARTAGKVLIFNKKLTFMQAFLSIYDNL